MEYSNAAFSECLRDRRVKAHMPQDVLSAKSGLSVGSIMCFESGSNTPDLDAAYALAVALGCGIDDLAGLPLPAKRGR